MDLPRSPAGRDAHKWAVIKVVTSLVPDSVVERRSEEATASFIATSVCPIFLVLHKCRITGLPAYSISLCKFRASKVANHWFVVMIGMPPGRIDASFEFEKLRIHSWF